MKLFILSMSLLFVLAGCSPTNEVEDITDPLSDSDFILTTDRMVKAPMIQFPSGELQESDYTPLATDKLYNVVFSDDGQSVSITPNAFPGLGGSMVGVAEESITDKQYFNLTSGTFAGGRFVVWLDDTKVQCELTIYGSGVPIILSERGFLASNKK